MNENPNWFQKVMELNPALLRGFLVALAAVLVQVVGREVIDDHDVEAVVNIFVALTALVAALWIRPAVTPNAKVVAYLPDPHTAPTDVQPGEAVIDSTDEVLAQDVLAAAQVRPAA